MKGKKSGVVATLGNGQAIAVGPYRAIDASTGRLAAAEGEAAGLVPGELVILPSPSWELEDITLVTDAESQKLVLEDLRARQLDLVCDYHHQSLYAAENNLQAIAAGWFPWQRIQADARGIVAPVRWTARARAMVSTGPNGEPAEYRYFSPVVIYEEATLRVVALLSVALTNTPRTNKQPPLSAAIAASIISTRRIAAASKEGAMKNWLDRLIWWLSLPATTTAQEAAQQLDKVKAQMLAEEGESEAAASAEFAKALPEKATILQAAVAAGLTVPQGEAQTAAAADLSEDVLTILDLPKSTTKVELKAHLVGMKTSMVPRSELEKKEQELAAARANDKAAKVDVLLASYKDRFTPAEEPELRRLAASDFEAVELSLKKRAPVVSASKGQDAPPAEPEPAPGAPRTMVVAGESRVVSEDGAEIFEANKAILAEKGWGMTRYAEANRLRIEREAAATK